LTNFIILLLHSVIVVALVKQIIYQLLRSQPQQMTNHGSASYKNRPIYVVKNWKVSTLAEKISTLELSDFYITWQILSNDKDRTTTYAW